VVACVLVRQGSYAEDWGNDSIGFSERFSDKLEWFVFLGELSAPYANYIDKK